MTMQPDLRIEKFYTYFAENNRIMNLLADSLSTSSSSAGSLSPMLTANRVAGPAPLSIIFDATEASSNVVQPSSLTDANHNQLHYMWNYGDTGVGNWWTTGRSKNTSIGYIGAHVYETPGTYTAQLAVYNPSGAGSVHNYSQQITVLDPNSYYSATFYVAASGNDNDPGTITEPYRTFDRGLSALFLTFGPRRMLVRRGDTIEWRLKKFSNIPTLGPYYIGPYGDGTAPLLLADPDDYGLLPIFTTSCTIDGLNFGLSGPRVSIDNVFAAGDYALMLNCYASGYAVLYATTSSWDSMVYGSSGVSCAGASVWVDAPNNAPNMRHAMVGCYLHGGTGHLTRVSVSKNLIANNRFSDSFITAMKLNGKAYTNQLHHVCVTNNIVSATGTGWQFEMGPQSNVHDEYASNILVEGNYFRPQANPSTFMVVFATKTTVRNNIFDMNDTAPLIVNRRGYPLGETPSGITIDHNTFVRVSGTPLYGMTVSSSDTTLMRNNIFVCLNGTEQAITANDINEINTLTTDPLFVDASNHDFRLQAGSAAVNTATGTIVIFDFDGNIRSGTHDIGALERQ